MALLEVERVTRRFESVVAVEDVSFQVQPGEVFGVIGPNGAGKSTLVNLISGVLAPSSGRILFDGRPIAGLPPWKVAALGISRTFQIVRLFQDLDVLQNLVIAQHLHRRPLVLAHLLRLPAQRREREALMQSADTLLGQLNLTRHRGSRVQDLSSAEQRRLQVAMALASGARLVLLDEPAAGLDRDEVAAFRELILNLSGRSQRSFVLIEHNVGLVMSMCHRVMVLNFGRRIAEGTPERIRSDPDVIAAYLGRRAAA